MISPGHYINRQKRFGVEVTAGKTLKYTKDKKIVWLCEIAQQIGVTRSVLKNSCKDYKNDVFTQVHDYTYTW